MLEREQKAEMDNAASDHADRVERSLSVPGLDILDHKDYCETLPAERLIYVTLCKVQ